MSPELLKPIGEVSNRISCQRPALSTRMAAPTLGKYLEAWLFECVALVSAMQYNLSSPFLWISARRSSTHVFWPIGMSMFRCSIACSERSASHKSHENLSPVKGCPNWTQQMRCTPSAVTELEPFLRYRLALERLFFFLPRAFFRCCPMPRDFERAHHVSPDSRSHALLVCSARVVGPSPKQGKRRQHGDKP